MIHHFYRLRSSVLAILALVLPCCVCTQAVAQEWIPLWSSGAPESKGSKDHDVPALLPKLAPKDKATGCAVIVCPGGGYGGLAMDHEGHQIAAWLNERGISAWILRYRLGTHGYHHPVQKGDVLRAIRTVRFSC